MFPGRGAWHAVLLLFIGLNAVQAKPYMTNLYVPDGSECMELMAQAQQGEDAYVMLYLAECYRTGRGVEQDDQKAFYWYSKSAELGCAEAQNEIAEYCYSWGKGVEHNMAAAVQWYKKAVDQGYVPAMFNLAWCYEHGAGEEKNLTKAFEYYLKAANHGYERAMVKVAVSYAGGLLGETQNKKAAFYWSLKGAYRNNKESQYNLAWIYENGEGANQNLYLARYWYQKAKERGEPRAESKLAELSAMIEGRRSTQSGGVLTLQDMHERANQGDIDACLYLARSYQMGSGCKKDGKEALRWCTKAAEGERADAMYLLGTYYEEGVGASWGRKNEDKAILLYGRAAEKGNARAQYRLAWLLRKKGDTLSALQSLTKAAVQGYVEAQVELGKWLEEGYGGVPDASRAVSWYRSAAYQGNLEAQYRLGRCYERGAGCRKNIFFAFLWYQSAATQSHTGSLFALGKIYESRDDIRNALSYITKAAEMGNAQAQFTMGEYYETGRYVPKDIDRADEWYKIAAAQGHSEAKKRTSLRHKVRRFFE